MYVTNNVHCKAKKMMEQIIYENWVLLMTLQIQLFQAVLLLIIFAIY